MSDDVFSTQTGDQTSKTSLEELVGEGKKFKTVEDLAKGKLEADSFIAQLEGELKGVKGDLTKSEEDKGKQATVAELIEAVKASQKQDDQAANQLSEEDLSKKIVEVMQGVSDTETRGQNRAKGNALVLKQVKGDVEAAKTFIAGRAKALGMTTDELAVLSELHPEAFAKLVANNPSTDSKGITSLNDLNPEVIANATRETTIDGVHTKAYYDALKKEMGVGAYWKDSKVQGQYYKDAMKLGDRFNQ